MGKNNNKSRKGSPQALSVPYSFPTNGGGAGRGRAGAQRKGCPLEVKQDRETRAVLAAGVSADPGEVVRTMTQQPSPSTGHGGTSWVPPPLKASPDSHPGLATCRMPQPVFPGSLTCIPPRCLHRACSGPHCTCVT